MFTSTQAFRGLRFLMLLITPLSFDFLRHLSYNVRNGEVCPFPEMNAGKGGRRPLHLPRKSFDDGG
jgi:hypothetical protein